MAKSIKIFRIQFGNAATNGKNDHGKPHIHKHSVYLQSKDIDWINKNSKSHYDDEAPEALAKDTRD
jgi:hypothetical protein